MTGLVEGISRALAYIEDNITRELDPKEIAAKAFISEFHFRRIFHSLCGYTLGEYIRCRRLSLAGQELSLGESKVIDVAVKYGYDSPDSFAKAFAKFHGISPSAAKEKGRKLQTFMPLKIKLTLEGGTVMEYKIIAKPAFTVMGRKKSFSFETSYQEIPKFWQEHMTLNSKELMGMYGICLGTYGQESFDYIIADNYIPQKGIPEGFITWTVPAGTYAAFPCKGKLPEALQNVNTKIWNEWMPNCKDYRLAGDYDLEVYLDEEYSEIWIPVEKV